MFEVRQGFNRGIKIETKIEDSKIARWLLILAILCAVLSKPMFRVHFTQAIAKSQIPLSIWLLYTIEILKVALFSWLAVTVGNCLARTVGLDVPELRYLIQAQFKNAIEAAKRTLPMGIFLGIVGFLVRLSGGFIPGDNSILEVLNRYNHGMSPVLVADAIFYQFSVTLWFNWGILAMATYAVSNLTGISGKRAFPWGNALASFAFGLFACISVYGPHRGEARASQYIAEAFLLYGLPNFFFSLGIRRWGLMSAIVGVSVGTLLGSLGAALL